MPREDRNLINPRTWHIDNDRHKDLPTQSYFYTSHKNATMILHLPIGICSEMSAGSGKIHGAPWPLLYSGKLGAVAIVSIQNSQLCVERSHICYPDSKFHGANMGSIWGRQEPGRPHVGPMNFAIYFSSFYVNMVPIICKSISFYVGTAVE